MEQQEKSDVLVSDASAAVVSVIGKKSFLLTVSCICLSSASLSSLPIESNNYTETHVLTFSCNTKQLRGQSEIYLVEKAK